MADTLPLTDGDPLGVERRDVGNGDGDEHGDTLKVTDADADSLAVEHSDTLAHAVELALALDVVLDVGDAGAEVGSGVVVDDAQPLDDALAATVAVASGDVVSDDDADTYVDGLTLLHADTLTDKLEVTVVDGEPLALPDTAPVVLADAHGDTDNDGQLLRDGGGDDAAPLADAVTH